MYESMCMYMCMSVYVCVNIHHIFLDTTSQAQRMLLVVKIVIYSLTLTGVFAIYYLISLDPLIDFLIYHSSIQSIHPFIYPSIIIIDPLSTNKHDELSLRYQKPGHSTRHT